MKKYSIIPLLLLSIIANSQVQNPESKIKKSQFYLLAGAPSIYAGFSYEYLVLDSKRFKLLPRAGFGLNIFKPSLGKEYDFHIGITGLYGNHHNLETGFGTIHYLLNQTNIKNNTKSIDYKFGLYGLIGYRYFFPNNPLSLKIAITPVVFANPDKWVFFPLAEIGVGLRF